MPVGRAAALRVDDDRSAAQQAGALGRWICFVATTHLPAITLRLVNARHIELVDRGDLPTSRSQSHNNTHLHPPAAVPRCSEYC